MPTFANVRAVLTEPDEFDTATGEPVKGLVATARRLTQGGNPQIASLLGGFTVDNDETRGVRATADGQTQAMLSQPIRDDELKAGLQLNELGDRPVSVFVVMPHELVKEGSIHSNVLRSGARPRFGPCTGQAIPSALSGSMNSLRSAGLRQSKARWV